MSAEAGRLAENIVHFVRALRAAGIPVGPGATLDALGAISAAGIGARRFKHCGRQIGGDSLGEWPLVADNPPHAPSA